MNNYQIFMRNTILAMGSIMLIFPCLVVAKIRKNHSKQNFPSETTSRQLFHKGMKGKAIFERLVKNFGGFEEVYTNVDLPNSYN